MTQIFQKPRFISKADKQQLQYVKKSAIRYKNISTAANKINRLVLFMSNLFRFWRKFLE